MKKLFLLFAIVFSFFFTSCKEDVFNPSEVTINLSNDCSWSIDVTLENLDDSSDEKINVKLGRKTEKLSLKANTQYRLHFKGAYDYSSRYFDVSTPSRGSETWTIDWSIYDNCYKLKR